jgi:transposase
MTAKIDREEFVALWTRGVKRCLIRRRFGVSNTSVTKAAKRFGLPLRWQPAKIRKDDFVWAWTNGMLVAAIMRRFRVGRTSVQKARKRYGLSPRANRGRPKKQFHYGAVAS